MSKPVQHPMVKSFIGCCRVERGLSSNTLDAYSRDLAALFAFLGDVDPKSLTTNDLSRYLAHMGGKGLSVATCNRHRLSLVSFFRFHGSNAAQDLDVPKQEQRLPKPLPQTTVAAMIDGTKAPGERLVLELLYGSGLRVSELATAHVENSMVRVTGKGAKDRVVPGTPFVMEWLPKVVGKRPCRDTIHQIVKRAAARVGIDAHPHQLRHSFATHLLANGCPINAISAMMGHESLCTTAGYTAQDIRAKRDMIEKYHPREQSRA